MKAVVVSALVPIACIGIVAMPGLANAQNKLTATVILQGTCGRSSSSEGRPVHRTVPASCSIQSTPMVDWAFIL